MGDARRQVTMTGDRVRMSTPGVNESFRMVGIAYAHLALDFVDGIAQIVAGPNAAGSFLTVSVEPERSVESVSPAPAGMKEEAR